MALRVLIAPDKFKGTLSATAAAEAISRGWRKGRPADVIEQLPMSDGGDGFGAAMGRLLGAREERLETVDAAHRPITAGWWWEPSTRTAIIESATAVGLALLPAGQFHPFGLDTYGLGALLSAASRVRANRCVVGVGGSATNDGGFGVARALGWRFRDGCAREITGWLELSALARLEAPAVSLGFEKLVVAVDVRNPLLGPAGCARVYGPQKGLTAGDIELAERCLGQLATVAAAQLGLACDGEPGAGAAGGLGFGLRTFAGAILESGFDVFARQAGLANRLKRSQLVLTGEGRMDAQTLMGKGVGQLALMCRSCAVPCVAFAGCISDSAPFAELFCAIHALSPHFTSQAQSLTEPAVWLERLAEAAAKNYHA
jgi:glycerate kinase